MSSLDQAPWRSGSPHGVRGALYSTGFPPAAVITSGGGAGRAWPNSGVPADTMNATIPETALTEAMNRMDITVILDMWTAWASAAAGSGAFYAAAPGRVDCRDVCGEERCAGWRSRQV